MVSQKTPRLSQKKSILVTGASGFCGRHLCASLTHQGRKVIAMTYGPSKRSRVSAWKCLSADLCDRSEIASIIKKYRPKRIYHLAAQSNDRLSWENTAETFNTNVHGLINLLSAVRSHSIDAKILVVSSSQVYGRTGMEKSILREEDLVWPQSPYAFSKAIAELVSLHYVGQYRLKIVIARPFNHTGLGQSSDFVISDWCRQIAKAELGKGHPFLQVGNTHVKRDFLHVSDVVRAYELIMEKGKIGMIYNVSTGVANVLDRYVKYLIGKSVKAIKIHVENKRLRRSNVNEIKGSAERLKKLGWKPKSNVYRAVDELLEEWRIRLKSHKESVS